MSNASSYPADWDSRRRAVYQRDNHVCQNCGAEGRPHGNVELHAHHIVPKSRGGTHDLSNLTTLCYDCHNAVHDHHIPRQTGGSAREYSQATSPHSTSLPAQSGWSDGSPSAGGDDVLTEDDLSNVDGIVRPVAGRDDELVEDLAEQYGLAATMSARHAEQAYLNGEIDEDEFERLIGFNTELAEETDWWPPWENLNSHGWEDYNEDGGLSLLDKVLIAYVVILILALLFA